MHIDSLDADLQRLLGGTLRTLGLTGALVAVAAGMLTNAAGVAGAIVGTGLVAVLFGGSALALRIVARRGSAHAFALLTGSALVRLALYGVVLAAVSDVAWLDSVTLAVATGIAVVVTLLFELRTLSRLPRLFWIDADATATQSVPAATRS